MIVLDIHIPLVVLYVAHALFILIAIAAWRKKISQDTAWLGLWLYVIVWMLWGLR